MNAYIFKIGSYYDETPDHEGVKLKSGAESNLKMISGLLTRSPGHWTVVILAFVVLIGLIVFLSIYGYKLRHKRQSLSPDTKPLLDKQYDENEHPEEKITCKKLWTKNNIIKLVVCGTLIVADLIVIMCFLFSSSSTFKQVAPSYYFMFKSSIKPSLSPEELADRVQMYRSKNKLPDGYDWIDQRD